MIQKYSNSQFIGNPIRCCDTFVPVLDIMNEEAKKLGITIYATSSHRNSTKVRGAIVTPAQKSNHLVGHALDCNLIDKDKKWWNSKALRNPTGDVKLFIENVKKRGVRWGGDFGEKDEVHFDDGLNVKDPKKWNSLYKLYQK